MKVLIGAAVATLLLAASAAAQTTTTTTTTTTTAAVTATSRCGTPPAQPPIPDGATSTSTQFQTAATAFNAWVNAVNTNLTCRAAEIHEMEAQAQSLTDQYHAEANSGTAATTAMQAQATINTQHGHTRSHNSGH